MSAKTKGKTARQKKKQLHKKITPVSAYFSPESSTKVGDLNLCSPLEVNMAPSPVNSQPNMPTTPSQEEDGPITRKDLDLLRLDIHKYFDDSIVEHIRPLKEKVMEMSEDLATTAKIAERSAELGLALKGEFNAVKEKANKMQDRLIILENKWRALNLKLRGFDEGAEEKNDLLLFIAGWLQEKIPVAENMASNIVKVQRLGPMALARRNYSRDILVQFSNPRVKDMVLHKARQRDGLTFKGKQILFLLDLSPETLEKRKSLKIITSKLHANNVRFRWSPASDILLFKNGALHKACDAIPGLALMDALALKLTPKEEEDLRKLFSPIENQLSTEEDAA